MRKISLLPILFFVLFSACKKDQSALKNSQPVRGFVALFNENNSLIDGSLVGTAATITNTSATVTAKTNSEGNFTVPAIKMGGMVTVTYSHNGFGEMKEYYTAAAFDSIQKGLLNLNDAILYQKSSVVVNSLTATRSGDDIQLVCNVTANDANSLNAIRFVIGKKNDMSFEDCVDNNSVSRGFAVKNGDNTINICAACEKQCGFKGGDTLYINAYGDLFPLVAYADREANRFVLPCLNTKSKSAVISFVVPQ